jgi:hypothetical protein
LSLEEYLRLIAGDTHVFTTDELIKFIDRVAAKAWDEGKDASSYATNPYEV